jgi:hypothetical protein
MASGQYQNVNGVKTLNLHGKNYVEVSERVHMVHEKKAVFSIIKSEPTNVADRWLWVAVIVVDGQQYIGNAEIKMNAPKNTPDGTNPFECGETSAIGRALAFAGFGSVESIASKDEIERGKPFSGTGQSDNSAPVTLAKPAEHGEQSVQRTSKPYTPVYNAGKAKHLWSDANGFYTFACAELGYPVNADTLASLTQVQLDQLMNAVNEEQPVAKAS